MTSQRYGLRLTTLVITVSTTIVGHAQESGDLFDPKAEVPATVYESVFSQLTGQRLLDAPQYPWADLYQPDGKFVPESAFGDSSSQMMMEGDMSEGMSHEGMNHETSPEMSMSSGNTDSRGVIKKIYTKDGKVKLKHGPINKLEMPGMTMIFYVKDPALLDGLSEGDEVGFDVEMDGSSFQIIRFEK